MSCQVSRQSRARHNHVSMTSECLIAVMLLNISAGRKHGSHWRRRVHLSFPVPVSATRLQCVPRAVQEFDLAALKEDVPKQHAALKAVASHPAATASNLMHLATLCSGGPHSITAMPNSTTDFSGWPFGNWIHKLCPWATNAIYP